PLAESWHQANGGTPAPSAAPSQATDARPSPASPLPVEPAVAAEQPDPMPASETVSGNPNAELQTPSEPQLSMSVQDAPRSLSWPLLPLVWLNQGFDACLAPLGAPGRWLCGPGRVV